MTILKTALKLGFAVSLGLSASFASAQETTGEGGLAMGEEVQTGTVDLQDVSIELIGDWELQCALQGPEPRPCRMYQLLTDETGTPVAEMTFFKVANPVQAVAGATFVVPLETLLTAQLTVAVEGLAAKRYPFAFCSNLGCISRVGFSQVDVDGFKGGSKAIVSIVPAMAPDQVVTVEMSLNGFTEAFEKAAPVNE